MSKNNCKGQCFKQFNTNLPFYIKKDDTNCDCTLIKCQNYHICKNELPEFLIDCFRGYCINCNLMQLSNNDFYKKSLEKEECRICCENDYLYKMDTCNHYFCANCIHDIHYTNYGKLEDYPIPLDFPYNNCEKCEEGSCKCIDYNEDGIHTYFENEDDPKWLNDEKIQEWKKENDAFEEFCENYIEKPILNECPLCRKEQNKVIL